MKRIALFEKPTVYFFDLDGTLVNSSGWHLKAFNTALNMHNLSHLTDQLSEKAILGIGSETVFKNLNIENERIETLAKTKRNIFNCYIDENKIQLFEGVKDLMDMLRFFGKKLYIITGSKKENAIKIIQKTKLNQYFDEEHIVSSEDSNIKGSKVGLFENALTKFNVKPDEAITIEDSESAVRDSETVNIKAVLVNQDNPKSTLITFKNIEVLYHTIWRAQFNNEFSRDTTGNFCKGPLYDCLFDEYKKYEFLLPKNTVDDLYCKIENVIDDRFKDDSPTKLDNYSFNSDKEFIYLLELAKRTEKPLYFYRIGGPLLLRKLMILYLKDQEYCEQEIRSLFKGITSLDILLPNPDRVEFLHRMDCEKVRNWGIWRIRMQIFRFAEALLEIDRRLHYLSKTNKRITIKFHENQVVWNFGIVDKIMLSLRSYGQGTGHDNSVSSKRFYYHSNSQIAESFFNFWQVTDRQHSTRELELKSFEIKDKFFPEWPGLFKGNAVLVSENDFDREDPNKKEWAGKPKEYILKICRNEKENTNETKFLKKFGSNNYIHFKPVALYSGDSNINKDYFECGKNNNIIAIERVTGVSIDDLLAEIYQIVYENSEKRYQASIILGVIIRRSLLALKEFQEITNESVLSKFSWHEIEKYPYETKLTDALNEVKGLIGPYSREKEFKNLKTEVALIGSELDKIISCDDYKKCIFRDAHLKNSIWKTDHTPSKLAQELFEMDIDDLEKKIGQSIKDIDFETTGYLVTEYEDSVHILFFELSGIDPSENKEKQELNFIMYYEKWLGNGVRNDDSFWLTILARSIREFCRRLWYRKTLPETYKSRYKNENITYFAHLGARAIKELTVLNKDEIKFPEIEKFLKKQIKYFHEENDRLRRPLYPTYTRKQNKNLINILHLSDLHFQNFKTSKLEEGKQKNIDIKDILRFLIIDIRNLRSEIEIDAIPNSNQNDQSCYIDYLVISGDFIAANMAFTEIERKAAYNHAAKFIHNLMIQLHTWEDRCILVPGNHDIFKTHAIDPDYQEFFDFYKKIKNPVNQHKWDQRDGALCIKNNDGNKVEFICLNSCYLENSANSIAGFHPNAFSNVEKYSDSDKNIPIRIVVMHHPIKHIENSRNKAINKSISEFSKYNINFVLSGHLHQDDKNTYNFESFDPLEIGSFGALSGQIPASVPRSYQLISIDKRRKKWTAYIRQLLDNEKEWEPKTIEPKRGLIRNMR